MGDCTALHELAKGFLMFMGKFIKGIEFKKEAVHDRFNGKFYIDSNTGCWEWKKGKYPSGYGKFKIRKGCELIETYAHRASYMIYIGELEKGLVVCHRCDNKSCVNPFHLFKGTYKDNTEDAQKKGRVRSTPHEGYDHYHFLCDCNGCVEIRRKKRQVEYRLRKEKKLLE